MKKTKSIPLSLLILAIATGLPAQSPSAQKESLLIGPGDALHIQVYDTPEMEQRARVTDAGECR
jgi:polysaccharide export outer membrane protein